MRTQVTELLGILNMARVFKNAVSNEVVATEKRGAVRGTSWAR